MRRKPSAAALAVCLLLFKAVIAASGASSNEGKPSYVEVVGSVFCDTCSEQRFTERSHFVSGATVAVECSVESPARSIRIEGKTNRYGEFRVRLPSSDFRSGGAESLKRCTARLLPNPRGPCRRASIAESSSLQLKSKKGGTYTYSAGALSYRPQSAPPLCSKSKDVARNPNSYHKAESSIFPPLFPPLFPPPPSPPPPSAPPLLPIPPLPSIPPLPPLPFLTPSPPPSHFRIPPIPFLQPPPPSILPPGLPFLNPPPILPFPPNPFLPPPVIPLPPLPPNPFLPPPLIPLPPLPPNPFLPPPLIPLPPLIPPASTLPPSVSTKQRIP